MPHVDKLLEAYHFDKSFQLGSSVVTKVEGVEHSISRFHHYHYQLSFYITYGPTFLTDLNLLKSYLVNKVVYSAYGTPYQCSLYLRENAEHKVLYQVISDHHIIIYVEGDSYRM